MEGTTQQPKCFHVIEYSLFICLCGLSVYFTQGVLDKFFSEKTSIALSEEPINELPSIMICFEKPNSRGTEYQYGSDFKILYLIVGPTNSNNLPFAGHLSEELKEGENSTLFDEIVYLEKIITIHGTHCFKLTSVLTNKFTIMHYTQQIYLYFNESINEENLPTSLKIIVTSEKNAYGVVYGIWYNGKIFQTRVDKGMQKDINLKPVQHNYLATNSKCIHESFYECISRLITADLNGSTSQCSRMSLPSLPLCNDISEETEEFQHVINSSIVNKALRNNKCTTKHCLTLEYFGEEVFHIKINYENYLFGFSYKIPSNSTTLYEEYLIYDTINAIGSVGGTLGMCIGFSFTGLISSLMNILNHAISVMITKFRIGRNIC